MARNIEWYESEAMVKICEIALDSNDIPRCLVSDMMLLCNDLEDFKYSLDLKIDRIINELERLRELVKALE